MIKTTEKFLLEFITLLTGIISTVLLNIIFRLE